MLVNEEKKMQDDFEVESVKEEKEEKNAISNTSSSTQMIIIRKTMGLESLAHNHYRTPLHVSLRLS